MLSKMDSHYEGIKEGAGMSEAIEEARRIHEKQ